MTAPVTDDGTEYVVTFAAPGSSIPNQTITVPAFEGCLDAWLAHAEPPESAAIHIALRSDDPDDLTLREARALANADRVCHAADVPRAILDRARADADRLLCDAAPTGAEGLTVDVRMA